MSKTFGVSFLKAKCRSNFQIRLFVEICSLCEAVHEVTARSPTPSAYGISTYKSEEVKS